MLLTVNERKNNPNIIHSIENARSVDVAADISPYPVVVSVVNAQYIAARY